jgi:hypothetical protein
VGKELGVTFGAEGGETWTSLLDRMGETEHYI